MIGAPHITGGAPIFGDPCKEEDDPPTVPHDIRLSSSVSNRETHAPGSADGHGSPVSHVSHHDTDADPDGAIHHRSQLDPATPT